jgi:predicted GNAT family acetyltransferase
VTAQASCWARGQGAAEVVLFTDLANPISNRIYQRIGFRAVADSTRIGFLEPPSD